MHAYHWMFAAASSSLPATKASEKTFIAMEGDGQTMGRGVGTTTLMVKVIFSKGHH